MPMTFESGLHNGMFGFPIGRTHCPMNSFDIVLFVWEIGNLPEKAPF